MDARESGVCVKWDRTYGWLATDAGTDLFVHHSEIDGDGFRQLRTGGRYTFARGAGPDGRVCAVDVRPVDE